MKQVCYYLIISILSIMPISSLSAASYNTSKVQILTSLQNNERLLNTLSSKVNYLMDSYASLKQRTNTLEQSLSAEKQNNQKLKRDISTLKKQLSDDRKQIQKSLNNVIDKVANETSKAINAAVKKTDSRNQPISDKNNKPSPVGSGHFYKYKVQPGATLSAIAKAYGVSVSSIRKANKLDDDLIRIGQVLYIPKK